LGRISSKLKKRWLQYSGTGKKWRKSGGKKVTPVFWLECLALLAAESFWGHYNSQPIKANNRRRHLFERDFYEMMFILMLKVLNKVKHPLVSFCALQKKIALE
jgi:hypothetical protein